MNDLCSTHLLFGSLLCWPSNGDHDWAQNDPSQSCQVEDPSPQFLYEGDFDEGHGDHDGIHAEGGILANWAADPPVPEETGQVVEHGIDSWQLMREVHDDTNH